MAPTGQRPAPSNETLLREILSGQASQKAQIEGVVQRLDDVAKDAREARDQSNRTATILEEQDIVSKLVELRREGRQDVSDLRSDVVAANTLLKKELHNESERREACHAELNERLEALEAERNKVVGVASFFSWLSRVAPWLLAGIAAFAAGLGFKERLP